MTIYRDNYPHNIEAPQRVYVQYSQDIPDFEYSNGNYPLGEEHEGFIWENVYIPVAHQMGELSLNRHVWMRWRVGERDAWTVPMRFTETYSNIEATETEEIVGSDQVRFRFKYTLDSGEVIYSEYMTLTNGADGISITNSEIIGTDLHITYSDGTVENVGRVVGYDGFGFPSAGSDISGNIAVVDPAQNVIWDQFGDVVSDLISFTSPIEYSTHTISHSNDDGYRHIPIGGNNGNALITDGSGNYSWFDLYNVTTGFIPWANLDDTATVGDVDKVYSADKIISLVNAATVGIKYSVSLYTDLASIASPVTGELAVVTSDPLYPNRPVYQYNGATWDHFFDLDAAHNHNDLYYQKTELNVSGGGGEVHWDNLTNVPDLYDYWTATADSGTVNLTDLSVLTIAGGNAIDTSISGNILTIDANTDLYTAGTGIDITGDIISHADTSSYWSSNNTGGYVIQNVSIDEFGHVIYLSTLNLDTRYSTLSNYLTAGAGITGSAFNGSSNQTWNLAYSGSGGHLGSLNNPARVDHNHTNNTIYNHGGITSSQWNTAQSWLKMVKLDTGLVIMWGNLAKVNTVTSNLISVTTTNPYPPDDTVRFVVAPNFNEDEVCHLVAASGGSIYMSGTINNLRNISFSVSYYAQ